MTTQFAFARRNQRAIKNPKLISVVLLSILAAMLLVLAVIPTHAKTPGSTYCFYGKCHRVKTITETKALIGSPIDLHASHYDACGRDRYNPCGLTSSGERFYPGRADNAASPIYPDGTVLLIWNEATLDTAVVRINNAGPYWGNRKLDVSFETANKLGFNRRGVAKLKTLILSAPTKRQARYSRNRTYRKVPGYIGKHKNLEDAHRITVAIMAVEALAGSARGTMAGGVVVASRFEGRKTKKQRALVAKTTKELKTAMHAPEIRWPDFVSPVALPPMITARSAGDGQVVTARVLITPKARTKPSATPRSSTASNQQRALQPTNVALNTRRFTSGEWLPPARQAVVLIQASDVNSTPRDSWLENGRLGFLFKLSKLKTTGNIRFRGRVSHNGQAGAGGKTRVANRNGVHRNQTPSPNHWRPKQEKSIRSEVL